MHFFFWISYFIYLFFLFIQFGASGASSSGLVPLLVHLQGLLAECGLSLADGNQSSFFFSKCIYIHSLGSFQQSVPNSNQTSPIRAELGWLTMANYVFTLHL